MEALIKLLEKEGQIFEIGANHPFLLNEPETVWLVKTGRVDIFAIKITGQNPVGQRTFMFSAEAQDILVGLDKSFFGKEIGLLAVGIANTQLLKIKKTKLQELSLIPEYQKIIYSMLTDWIVSISSGVRIELSPKTIRILETGKEISLKKGEATRTENELVWVKQIEGTSVFVRWGILPTGPENIFFPMSKNTWLMAVTHVKLQCLRPEEFFRKDPSWQSLDVFHQFVLDTVCFSINVKKIKELDRITSQVSNDHTLIQTALGHLISVLHFQKQPIFQPEEIENPLFAACKIVCQTMKINIQPMPKIKEKGKNELTLRDIARISRFKVRRVVLKDKWWKNDNGPLLGFMRESRKPVALIPLSATKYELVNPEDFTQVVVTESVASKLSPEAFVFYRPFPEKPLSFKDVFLFGFTNCKKDMASVFLMGIAGGLLGMMFPLATGFIFDTIIPGAEKIQLLMIGLGLFFASLGGLMFQITKSFALRRIQTKMHYSIHVALWDRLISLPASFFRKYTVGNIITMAEAISEIRDLLPIPVLSLLLTSIFSIFNFFILFYYNVKLALLAAGLTITAVSVSVTLNCIKLHYDKKIVFPPGILSGMVIRFINGMSKLRVAGAELRAYFKWAKEFSMIKELYFKSQSLSNISDVFMHGFYVFSMTTIFWFFAFHIMKIGMPAEKVIFAGFSTGAFLGFFTAFGQFLTSAITLNEMSATLTTTIPLFECIKPILETVPEVDLSKTNPGELIGNIELNNVCFRYSADGPEILKNISIKVKAGEFVALVGPSGAGKSTIFRLPLGFEKPVSGSIYYDEWNMDDIDMGLVRNQLGVVLQNSRILAGDIFSNIVGDTGLTIDAAWEAARMVGLEEEIKQMPMGMHTFVTEGGSNLSGGQRQRLLIARALIKKPRIILFDEATSALDNRTQDIISRSIENLKATRIVIGHRLSTIIKADRIYVVLNGEIVQSGTYQELIAVDGPFAKLSRRQLL